MAGTGALIIGRYRSQDVTLFVAIGQHFKWLMFMVTFFGGLSYHCAVALAAHAVGWNLTWSTTVKDLRTSTVFKEIPILLRRFWVVYLIMFSWIAALALLMTDVFGPKWQVASFTVVLPALWCAVWQ